MNNLTQRVKNKVRHGKKIYVVWTYYPYCGLNYREESRGDCEIEEVTCMGRPFNTSLGHASFFGFTSNLTPSNFCLENGLQKYISGKLCALYFPGDMGLMRRYSAHRAFFSKRKAQKYVDLVKSGCEVCEV